MTEGSLGRRYAKALFQLARDAAQEEKIGRELEEFYRAYTESDLQQVLVNPAFALEVRKRILGQVTEAEQLSGLTRHFLSLLADRDRLPHLANIVGCYRRLLNEAQGRVEAKVVSPSPLELDRLEQVRAQLRGLSGKDVVLEQETDPGLLGGLLIELEGKVYDGSIRTQLENMKQRISRGY
ncbi:MAG TPA: ATP synthase F1 subunit delta [Candidatus Binatia bacterium]